jgi:hypothetical protein
MLVFALGARAEQLRVSIEVSRRSGFLERCPQREHEAMSSAYRVPTGKVYRRCSCRDESGKE